MAIERPPVKRDLVVTALFVRRKRIASAENERYYFRR